MDVIPKPSLNRLKNCNVTALGQSIIGKILAGGARDIAETNFSEIPFPLPGGTAFLRDPKTNSMVFGTTRILMPQG